MTTTIDYRAQAEEFARWLCTFPDGKRRKFISKTKVAGRCPKPGHDDKNPSFGYDVEKDAYACSCSQGKGSELMQALGWKPERPLNGDAALRPAATFKPVPTRDPDAVYLYANGNRKLKWRAPEKHVVWRHEDGRPGIHGEPGIYRLEEAVATDGVIHVSESESDVDALWELGLAAISTPHGASSPWKDLPPALAGRKLALWEHQDDAGRKYAAAMVAVAKAGGSDAAIARPLEPHKDVRDWIAAGAARVDVESLAESALFDFPRAEPADELLAADLKPPEYVIQPIAIRENLTLIQGEPKAGKSAITLYFAMCAALGAWPADRWSVPKPARVLYITWEDGRRRIQKRLRQFLLGLGEPFKPVTSVPNLFFYSKSKGPTKAPRIRLETPEGRILLGKLITAHRADLVVLDTLSHLTAVDENAKEKMQPVMDALTDLTEETGAAIILNHHTGKEGKGSGGKSTTYKSRGSSVIPAAPDVILHLGDRGKTNSTPCRMISREDDGDGFILEYLQEGKEIVRLKLVDEDEGDADSKESKAEFYAARKLIIENVASLCQADPYGASRKLVATTCRMSVNTATKHLEKLADEGSLQKKLIETTTGPAWRYAPVTHEFPTMKGQK